MRECHEDVDSNNSRFLIPSKPTSSALCRIDLQGGSNHAGPTAKRKYVRPSASHLKLFSGTTYLAVKTSYVAMKERTVRILDISSP